MTDSIRRARLSFTITDKEMNSFAQLSGDVNPLHTDESYAKAHGLKGRVAYGGLIVASISRLLGMELPGPGWVWHSLKIQFKSPLYMGETAEVSGSVTYVNEELGVMRLAIDVRLKDRLIAEGEVQCGALKSPDKKSL